MRYNGSKKERLALSTFVKLLRICETVSGRVHNHLKSVQLTTSQFGVLEALYHLGPMCQRDIAKKILKSTANLTTVIDNLEKRGLVKRERDEKDRRYFNVILTKKGEKLIRKIFPSHANGIVSAMENLTKSEQKQLGMLCKKLAGKV